MWEHEDYRDRRSPRHRTADFVFEELLVHGLADAERPPSRSTDGKWYEVPLVHPQGELLGRVQVYGVGYLLLRYHVLGEDIRVTVLYGSAEEALAHLLLALGEGRPDLALTIPGRPRKRPKKDTERPT